MPALLAGMAEQRKEIDAIAKNPAAPTFENTIVAMERSGQLLTRASAVFGNLTASNTNAQLEELQTEMSPKLSAHSDAIFLDPALFARVRTLYEQRATLGLDPESLRLLERYHTNFVRAGAQLSDADKARLKQLNEQISTLTTEFRQNVLKGVNAAAVVVDNRARARRPVRRADRRRRRSREGAQARRQVGDRAAQHHDAAAARAAQESRAARAHLPRVDRPRLGRRVRHDRRDRADREAARRARRAARLPQPRRLRARRRDRAQRRRGEQACSASSRRRRSRTRSAKPPTCRS